MDKEMDLKEWTIHFVKNKDVMHKNLVDYKEQDNIITFNFKDKKYLYSVSDNLAEESLSFVKNEGSKTIICVANKNNLKFLIDNWHIFKIVQNLMIIFVRVSDNKRWIINPFVHNSICDDFSLVLGLESMYSNTF